MMLKAKSFNNKLSLAESVKKLIDGKPVSGINLRTERSKVSNYKSEHN